MDGPCMDLPMKEHSRAVMNGDPGWPEKTKRRNSRYARSQNVETAEYSCSLELEPRSFLIVYADVDVTWEVGDCMAVCMLGTARFWIGRLGTVHWETVDCALGDCGLCIGRLGTVHWEVRNCALGDCGLCIGRLGTVHWEAWNCLVVDWEAGDCLVVQWELGNWELHDCACGRGVTLKLCRLMTA